MKTQGIPNDAYEPAPSGVKGDTAYRCLTCGRLVANRRDHRATCSREEVTQ